MEESRTHDPGMENAIVGLGFRVRRLALLS